MNELPSLTFPSPSSRLRGSSRAGGIGGRRRGHYAPLELRDMDEVPLMVGDERGGASDEEEEEGGEEEEGKEEGKVWHGVRRKRWQHRMRSRGTLLGLVCGGGWQVVLNK